MYFIHTHTVHTIDTHTQTNRGKGKQPQHHHSKKIIYDRIQSTETEAEDEQGGRWIDTRGERQRRSSEGSW